jgi:competence protein ComEC
MRATPARSALRTVAAGVLCIGLGTSRYSCRSAGYEPLHETGVRGTVAIGGEIADEPECSREKIRFAFDARMLIDNGRAVDVDERLLVTVRNPQGKGDRLTCGTRLLLRGRLASPSRARNPGEFNARAYYEAKGIGLFMRVRSADSVTVVPGRAGPWWMHTIVLPLRRALLGHIAKSVGGEEGEFLKGLMIGERSGLSFPLREAFIRSGTAHILAVSGSNVGVIVAMVMFLLHLFRANRWVRAVVTTFCIVLYAALTGGDPPVVRAGVMAGVLLMAGLVQERPNPTNALGVSAVIMMLADPRQLFDVGFQLSYAAVLAILLFYPALSRVADRIAGKGRLRFLRWPLLLVAVSLAATAGTLPLTAYWFGRVSVIGLLANVMVVPAAGVSVVLGVAAAAASLVSNAVGGAYAAVNSVILHATIAVAEWCGGLPFAAIETPGFRLVDAVACSTVIGALHAGRKSPGGAAIAIALAILLMLIAPASPLSGRSDGTLRVTFLDVGQGDAAVVELPDGRVMLVDAGGWSAAYDAGERVVAPFLRRYGIHAVDALVVTHPHGDHAGGAPAVMRTVPVARVLGGGGAESLFVRFPGIAAGGRQVFQAGACGDRIDGGEEVRIFILWPPPGTPPGIDETGTNNSSLVMKVCFGPVSFLFAGDAGIDAEAEMIDRFGAFLHATVLKVGHHGSSGSTSTPFLQAVAPRYAVVSVGAGNRFGHPSATTLNRLAAAGTDICRTDEDGAVMFETDGRTITRVEWR